MLSLPHDPGPSPGPTYHPASGCHSLPAHSPIPSAQLSVTCPRGSRADLYRDPTHPLCLAPPVVGVGQVPGQWDQSQGLVQQWQLHRQQQLEGASRPARKWSLVAVPLQSCCPPRGGRTDCACHDLGCPPCLFWAGPRDPLLPGTADWMAT